MSMPPPPTRRRNAPPPPPSARKATTPPAPPKSREQAEYELERSYVVPFCEGRFDQIPAPYLARLYEYCMDLSKPYVTIRHDVSQTDLIGAVFCYTDYPFCTWAEASRQLKDKVQNHTPFTAISPECLEWLAKECDFKAAMERHKELYKKGQFK